MTFMGLTYILSAIAGVSTLALLSLPELKKWHRRQTVAEKLRLVSEALEDAEESLTRFQERHDRILYQITTRYWFLHNRELDEALADARKALEKALQFSVTLRQMQVTVVSSYPCDHDCRHSDVFLF